MSDADNDPVLRRAIDELRRLPAADAEAMRRVVAAAAVARVTPADEPASADLPRRGRSVRLWRAVSVAAAAAVVGFLARGAWMPAPRVPAVATLSSSESTAPTADGIRAVRMGAEPVAIQQQFILENRTARHISVVGDFNNWNAERTPMTRSSDGTWSALVPLSPGRHVYGYMVDDSLFTLDPRVPTARDPDLGTDGSVIVVGRP